MGKSARDLVNRLVGGEGRCEGVWVILHFEMELGYHFSGELLSRIN